MTIDTNFFKGKLEEEKTKLEGELATLGQKNPSNPTDWEGIPAKLDTDPADEEEIADAHEGFDTNEAILVQLEARLAEVNLALEKIEKGTYGICEVNGEPIEEDRLNANPAAKTCKLHMNSSPVV